MKKLAVAISMAVLPLAFSATAVAAPDQTATVNAGGAFAWTGSVATGLNQNYWGAVDADGAFLSVGKCDKTELYYCDTALIQFSNPVGADGAPKSKTARVTIEDFAAPGDPVQDFDLLVYASDSSGTKGPELAHDGSIAPGKTLEEVAFPIRTTQAEPSKWVLVHVVYYTVINGGYSGRARF